VLLNRDATSFQRVPAQVQYPLRALQLGDLGRGDTQWFVQTPEDSFKHPLRHRILLDVFSSSGLPLRVYSFSCAVVRLRRMMFQKYARAEDSVKYKAATLHPSVETRGHSGRNFGKEMSSAMRFILQIRLFDSPLEYFIHHLGRCLVGMW
jgi:hypothetical protein